MVTHTTVEAVLSNAGLDIAGLDVWQAGEGVYVVSFEEDTRPETYGDRALMESIASLLNDTYENVYTFSVDKNAWHVESEKVDIFDL